MQREAKPSIELLTWPDVREQVQQINPKLANIIDEFDPSKEHCLIRVRYPYGVDIRDHGQFQLPTETGDIVNFDDYPSKAIKKLLDYNYSPLGLILDKTVEVYVRTPEGRTIPFKLFRPGVTFGVWEIMRWPQILMRLGWEWSISSGAKTLFLLPKITDSLSHSKLQRSCHIKSYIPDSIFDHHRIFTDIANATSTTTWQSEILFFSKTWLEPQENNIGWIKLKSHWMQEAWNQMLYWGNKLNLDFNWEKYLLELSKKKIKYKPYLLDTVKHLFAIGCGTIPGFRITDNDNGVAPIADFQNAYLNGYGLKSYAPLIMQPDLLSTEQDIKTVYYSLQHPTLPQKPPESNSVTSAMKLLRELKMLIDIYTDLSKSWKPVDFSNSLDFINTVQFNYFHNEQDQYEIINNTESMLDYNSHLKTVMQNYPDREFPLNSSFFRGCIQVSIK